MPRSSFAIACLAALGVVVASPSRAQPFVPLTDLAEPYLLVGEPGLYPGGGNVPTGDHLSSGQAHAAAIEPLDAAGNPDSNGLIGLLVLGMSNANQEGSRFEREADRRREHAGRVVIVNAAQGGVDAFGMDDPSDPFWSSTFDSRLAAAGIDPDQVQVAWLESSEMSEAVTGEFPARIEALRAAFRGVVTVLFERCPNLQLVLLSSRSWTAAGARQAFAYETGFAIKGLIQDEIDDVDALASGPWLGWGPYLWADGATPRADGFVWLPGDFESDGVHPGPTAEWKVGNLLRAQFREHELARDWYLPPDDTLPVVLDALADALVDPATPDGGGSKLPFDGNRRIYLKFALAALPGPVVHAKLSLEVDPDDQVGAADLHLVLDDSWTEGTLTWNNAPAIELPRLARAPYFSRGSAWSADVTAQVEAARLAGEPEISFALVPAGGGVPPAAFVSRDGGEPPRLVLTLDVASSELPIWSDGFESGDAWFWD